MTDNPNRVASVLRGPAVTCSTSNSGLATVTSGGWVATPAPGGVTVTATSQGRAGAAIITSVIQSRCRRFIAPFTIADYKTSNYFDHNIPKEFIDYGVYAPWWGENSVLDIDGHSGCEWQMPTDTPISSVAAGTVSSAWLSRSFTFPAGSTLTTTRTTVQVYSGMGANTHRALLRADDR